jgi:hypothetical protein
MPRAVRSSKKTTAGPTNGNAESSVKKPSLSTMPNPENSNGSDNLEQEVRRRAYELYEQRGRQDGMAEEDWLRAEAEVLGRSHGTRTA